MTASCVIRLIVGDEQPDVRVLGHGEDAMQPCLGK